MCLRAKVYKQVAVTVGVTLVYHPRETHVDTTDEKQVEVKYKK